VQGDLTAAGQHRSAGPVDLVVAATAELFGLTLLHHDRDFATIAGVTGQALRWYGAD
jgi:predicted nucleic acid-binding protein